MAADRRFCCDAIAAAASQQHRTFDRNGRVLLLRCFGRPQQAFNGSGRVLCNRIAATQAVQRQRIGAVAAMVWPQPLTADVQSQWTNAVAAMQCSQPHRSNSQRSNDSGSALLLRCHGLKKLSKPPKSLKILKRTKKSIKIPKRKKAPKILKRYQKSGKSLANSKRIAILKNSQKKSDLFLNKSEKIRNKTTQRVQTNLKSSKVRLSTAVDGC